MRVQIEMDDTRPNNAGYGRIHKAGCRDLRDGMDLNNGEDVSTISEIVDSLDDIGWDGYDESEARTLFAPCVKGIR